MTLEEASKRAGAPQVQLLRWAAWRAIGYDVGPVFSGHPSIPKNMQYTAEAIDAWLEIRAERNAT